MQVMDRSFDRVEWKPLATAGNRSQSDLPLIGEVPSPNLLSGSVLRMASFNGCLNEAAKNSGLEDFQIADQIHISAGYMSRFMRGVAWQWAKRLIAFMRVTNSLAPLQWLADQMGCDLAQRAGNAARIRELEMQLLDERRRASL